MSHELEENKIKVTVGEHRLFGTSRFKTERKAVAVKLSSSKFRAAVF